MNTEKTSKIDAAIKDNQLMLHKVEETIMLLIRQKETLEKCRDSLVATEGEQLYRWMGVAEDKPKKEGTYVARRIAPDGQRHVDEYDYSGGLWNDDWLLEWLEPVEPLTLPQPQPLQFAMQDGQSWYSQSYVDELDKNLLEGYQKIEELEIKSANYRTAHILTK